MSKQIDISPPPPAGADRIRLLDLPSGRLMMFAYVGRFGKTSVGRTVLLRRIHYSGQIILDHQWFRAGRWSANLCKFDIVALRIRGLEKYTRGYQSRNNGEAYGLNTPIRADVVTPTGFPALIANQIDDIMVHLDRYDIKAVCRMLRREEIIIHTDFQKAVERGLSEYTIDRTTGEIVAGYMTNRLHQYGSERVNSQAIRRSVAKRRNAKMARGQGAARTDDVGASALSDHARR